MTSTCPKIKVAIGVSCRQAKQKGHNDGEPPFYWPLDKDTTFDFSVTPLTRPPGWTSDSASFRIVVPAMIPTTEDSTESNTAEGVAAHLAAALNSALAGSGVTVTSGSGGNIAAGNSRAGAPLGLLEFDCIKGLDTVWDYSKVHGFVWGEPGTSDPGEPPPPVPRPVFPGRRPPNKKWPGWGPGAEPERPRGKPKPPKPGKIPKRKGPIGEEPKIETIVGYGAIKQLMLGVHLYEPGNGFPSAQGGWHYRTFSFPVEWSEEQVASVVLRHAGAVGQLRPPYPTNACVNGIMWGVDASIDAPPGRLHYMLRLDPLEVRPVLPMLADTQEHVVRGSPDPAPGEEEPAASGRHPPVEIGSPQRAADSLISSNTPGGGQPFVEVQGTYLDGGRRGQAESAPTPEPGA